MRRRVTPLGAIGRGVLAGIVGSAVQDLFFRLTSKFAPKTPKDVFDPPEREQKKETATETVARRLVEGMAQRRLDDKQKKLAARLVHYGYGARWGAAYGLVRESISPPRTFQKPKPANYIAAILGYSALVWMVSDNLLLPLFRLAAWPQRYPLKTHAYALAAHVPYGAGMVITYETSRRKPLRSFIALTSALLFRLRMQGRLPKQLAPIANRAIAARAFFGIARRDLSERGRAVLEDLRN